MARVRDMQRSKLYNAERKVGAWKSLTMTFPETIEYVHRVIDSEFWKDNVNDPRKPRIADGRGCRAARGGYMSLVFPCWSRTRLIVLHELSHVAMARTRAGIAAHGREFAAFYLKIVRRFLGVEAHDELRAAFVAGGVKYKPKKVLSPEQRAVMRERGLALAASRKPKPTIEPGVFYVERSPAIEERDRQAAIIASRLFSSML